ncbi:hypothetical protein KAU25_02300 [Candidatus Bathyarchaeota archaeon]|nr:hypothetical protein [Candidatus Bathyarchaeota archaeon]
MESDQSDVHRQSQGSLQLPMEMYSTPAESLAEQVKKQRLSALIDGIFIGVGIVFILLGILMPISNLGMLVQGLLSIIVGIVVTAIGVTFEIYNFAKLR